MQYTRLQRAINEEADAGPLVFMASTPGTKRDGLDTASLPWRVDNFRLNPVVTWSHDFDGKRLPIGRAEVEVIDTAAGEYVRAAITFDRADPFAAEVERKYRDGFLHAVSVSWDDIDASGTPVRAAGGRAAAHELLEIAAVPVPGDPLALQEKRADALRSMARELIAALEESGAEPDSDAAAEVAAATCEDCAGGVGCACGTDSTTAPEAAADARADAGDDPLSVCECPHGALYPAEAGECPCDDCEDDRDDEADDEGARDAVAAEMVAVFNPASDDSDATRSRRYRALLPAYRRLGWTAPELLPAAELAALDGDVWRGLFVSGELERLERVGKELSAANLAGLRDALAQLEAGCDALRTMVQRVESGKDRGAAEPAPAELSPEEIARAIIDSLSVRIERA